MGIRNFLKVVFLLHLLSFAGCREQIPPKAESIVAQPTPAPISEPQRLIETAAKYLYVRESDGPNRSPDIDRWNTACGVDLGSPYCAAFISQIHKEAGIHAVNSAYCPDWFKSNIITFPEIQKGDVGGLFFQNKGRVAHVFLIKGRKGAYIVTVEANTSPQADSQSAKDREGDGVYNKLRSAYLLSNPHNKFSRWWR